MISTRGRDQWDQVPQAADPHRDARLHGDCTCRHARVLAGFGTINCAARTDGFAAVMLPAVPRNQQSLMPALYAAGHAHIPQCS
jgi:hypothetical protein